MRFNLCSSPSCSQIAAVLESVASREFVSSGVPARVCVVRRPTQTKAASSWGSGGLASPRCPTRRASGGSRWRPDRVRGRRRHFVQNVLSGLPPLSARVCVCVCVLRTRGEKPANAYLILVISKDNRNS